ncbi:MAG TPA: hypothetical protein VHB54_18555 [Mucilaginibacter sp.]|nr:hypothetical protein [Mucilaginibacter sp.]
MHPFLTKLGIRTEVQEYFAPWYDTDPSGNLVFPYGRQYEIYSMAFHAIPTTESCWQVGNSDLACIREVFICGSAMEAITWLHIHYSAFTGTDTLLFLSTGNKPGPEHFRFLADKAKSRRISLLFGNDLLGKVCDLKTAAELHRQPAAVSAGDEQATVIFRNKNYTFSYDTFSLNAFEKASNYYFKLRTLKPKGFNTWLDLLESRTFNQ